MATKTNPPANDNVDPRLALLSMLDALGALDAQLARTRNLLAQMEDAADKQSRTVTRLLDRAKTLTDSLTVAGK